MDPQQDPAYLHPTDSTSQYPEQDIVAPVEANQWPYYWNDGVFIDSHSGPMLETFFPDIPQDPQVPEDPSLHMISHTPWQSYPTLQTVSPPEF